MAEDTVGLRRGISEVCPDGPGPNYSSCCDSNRESECGGREMMKVPGPPEDCVLVVKFLDAVAS